MELQGTVDISSEFAMECLWYCFHTVNVLQVEFNAVRERWNSHRIRKSGNDTVAERPDSLYFLPALHAAFDNGVPITSTELRYVTQHVIEDDAHERNDSQDYFNYARTSLSILVLCQKNWEEALSLLVHETDTRCRSW